MIDKKTLIGGAVAVVALLGVSVATGKIDISKLTGSTSEPEVSFERKLPPPVADESAQVAASADNADPLADISTDGGSQDFIAGLMADTGEPTDVTPPVEIPGEAPAAAAAVEATPIVKDASPKTTAQIEEKSFTLAAPRPAIKPVAQLASTQPANVSAGAVATPAAPAAPAALPGPPLGTLPNGQPVMAPNSVDPAAFRHPAPSQMAPPANVPGAAASGRSVPAALPSAAPSVPGSTTSVSDVAIVRRAANMPKFDSAAAIASFNALPDNATGEDLMRLQTQLAMLEKRKAIAAGQEAIAESQLKAAKATYELQLIGQPSAEEQAKIDELQAQRDAMKASPQVQQNHSPIADVRLVSTTRTGASIGATVQLNGKLIDVRKGSIVSGYLVDKITDHSVVFVGEGETKTVWIN